MAQAPTLSLSPALTRWTTRRYISPASPPLSPQYLPYIYQVHNLTADTQKLRARVADKEAAVQKGHAELASTGLRAEEREAEVQGRYRGDVGEM